MNNTIINSILDDIRSSETRKSSNYSHIFRSRISEDGDIWDTLSKIFFLHEKFDDAGQPFCPVFVSCDGRRSFLPDDLNTAQLDELKALLEEIDDAEFCARIADILWLRTRNRNTAERAVRFYLDSALQLEDLNHWTESVGRYTRAYRLATQLGRNGLLRREVLDVILTRVNAVDGNDPRWWSLKLMQLLYEARHGEIDRLVRLANNAATLANRNENFRLQRDYLGLVVKLHSRANRTELAECVKNQIARTYWAEAEVAERSGNYFASHNLWEDALRAYRQRPLLRGNLSAIQSRLSAAGRETLKQLRTLSYNSDVTEIINHIRSNFTDTDIETCIYRFAQIPIENPDMVREEIESTEGRTLTAIASCRFCDYEGRTVGISPSAVFRNDPQYEVRIQSEIQLSMIHRRGFHAQSQIAIARQCIVDEHIVDIDLIKRIFRGSSFIPENRFEQISKGIYLGFLGDFFLSACVLVPQFESSLRFLAELRGGDPWNISPSGVVTAWNLEKLLNDAEISNFLGKSITFEIKSILIEDFGPKFRHNLLHGLIPDDHINGTDAMYAWWLFLRISLMLTPSFHAFLSEEGKRG